MNGSGVVIKVSLSPGSHEKKLTQPYIEFVKDFLSEKNYSVTDLGCGISILVKNFTLLKKYIASIVRK